MTKTHLTLIAGFVLALAAGFVAGWSMAPQAAEPGPPRVTGQQGHGAQSSTTQPVGPHHQSLAEQLHLTPDQAKQMEAIWSGVARRTGPETRRKAEQEREAKINDLFGTDQSAGYEKIMQDYRSKLDAAVQEARKKVEQDREQAVEALLPAEKAAEYRKIMQDYRAGVEATAQKDRKDFEDAVAKTDAILTPEQRAIYDGLIHRRMGGRGGRGPGGPGGPGQAASAPSGGGPHGEHD